MGSVWSGSVQAGWSVVVKAKEEVGRAIQAQAQSRNKPWWCRSVCSLSESNAAVCSLVQSWLVTPAGPPLLLPACRQWGSCLLAKMEQLLWHPRARHPKASSVPGWAEQAACGRLS